jgi:hypothetical protein
MYYYPTLSCNFTFWQSQKCIAFSNQTKIMPFTSSWALPLISYACCFSNLVSTLLAICKFAWKTFYCFGPWKSVSRLLSKCWKHSILGSGIPTSTRTRTQIREDNHLSMLLSDFLMLLGDFLIILGDFLIFYICPSPISDENQKALESGQEPTKTWFCGTNINRDYRGSLIRSPD